MEELPALPSTVLPNSAEEKELANRNFERLRWRCRRGLLELDLTLQNFLHQGYHGLSAAEREAFDKLLALPDDSLLAYVQGTRNPPEKELMCLVSKIRQ
ncbi:MAG: FAD assembly factor SdhE [Sulfuricaulis sp.]